MTVVEAAKQWVAAKRAIAEQEPKLKTAAEVLKAHFRRSGKADYRGLIGYSRSVNMILDQQKVAELLGDDLPKYKRPSTRETLSLLKP